MTTDKNEISGARLMDLAEAALRITGTPAFASADYEGEVDSLQFVEADDPDDSTWAFVPFPVDQHGNPHVGCDCCHDDETPLPPRSGSRRGEERRGGEALTPLPSRERGRGEGEDARSPDDDELEDSDLLDDSILPVDTVLAAELIKAHLRDWLAERGWQVQLEMFKSKRRWRLADCLSFTDGGGDRLDTDYPAGEDELTVLCESVVAVSHTDA